MGKIMKRTCKQCGVEFTLTPEEIAFYQSKNLQLPKRCEQCRRENKSKAGGEPAQQTVRPYYAKKNDRGKWWAAAAAVLVLLIAGIGVFQSGRLFERDTAGKGLEVSAEVEESLSAAADGQTELSADDKPEPFAGTDDSVADVQSKETDEPAAEAQPEIPEVADTQADTSEVPPHDENVGREQGPIYAFYFRQTEYLQEHFEKHGAEFGYTSAEEYLEGANRVIASSEALHKLEAEDGDDVYYLEATNEFVIVSTDGYLRTYFKPEDGKAYFDRQ